MAPESNVRRWTTPANIIAIAAILVPIAFAVYTIPGRNASPFHPPGPAITTGPSPQLETPNFPAVPPGESAPETSQTSPTSSLLLSDITTPSVGVAPNGYRGYGAPRSVAVKCNNEFAGEPGAAATYNLSGLPSSKLTGALAVLSIPSDRVVTIQMIIVADDRQILSEMVSSEDPIVPFSIDLNGARVLKLAVICSAGADDRGVFAEASLS